MYFVGMYVLMFEYEHIMCIQPHGYGPSGYMYANHIDKHINTWTHARLCKYMVYLCVYAFTCVSMWLCGHMYVFAC